jgi:hypothetical protein
VIYQALFYPSTDISRTDWPLYRRLRGPDYDGLVEEFLLAGWWLSAGSENCAWRSACWAALLAA